MGAGRHVQRVIGLARHDDCGVGVKKLCSRLHVRDHLHVDAGCIHIAKAHFAKIIELPCRRVRGNATRTAIAVAQLGYPKVLLDGDNSFLGQHCPVSQL